MNYDSADPYSVSPTCCSGSGSILSSFKPTKPPLSEAGRSYATNYGLDILNGRRNNRSLAESRIESNPNIEYVGDKFITILILEDGNIYDVHVTNTDGDEVQL